MQVSPNHIFNGLDGAFSASIAWAFAHCTVLRHELKKVVTFFLDSSAAHLLERLLNSGLQGGLLVRLIHHLADP